VIDKPNCQDASRLQQELFAAATRDASTAMCRWTNSAITLALDEVREIELEEVCSQFEVGESLSTMVVLTLQGEVGGDMILAFDRASGKRVAACLLGQTTGPEDGWDDLEKSALTETANILGCAYMNVLSRMIDTPLVPTPPVFIEDYAASALEQALMVQAISCDRLVLGRTIFRWEGQSLCWQVFLCQVKECGTACAPSTFSRLDEAVFEEQVHLLKARAL
jgi:chemotaxis protein CheC